jgi:hypothetical protein
LKKRQLSSTASKLQVEGGLAAERPTTPADPFVFMTKEVRFHASPSRNGSTCAVM